MPQNLKTEPLTDVDGETLPDLEPQQFEFVQQIVYHGKKIVEAYREAYNPTNPKAAWVQAEASKIRASRKISVWIDILRRQAVTNGSYTLEQHIGELTAAMEECKASGNMGAYVNALKAKGQAAGLYVALHEDITKRNRSPAEMISEIRAKLGNEAADVLAKSLGVEPLKPTSPRRKTKTA